MEIIIRQNSREKIYEQIISQIKMHIAKEELQIGDPLPSMRKLAQELKISVISVQRAYEELQNEGIIESITGKGCFVSSGIDTNYIKEALYEEIEEKLANVIEISKRNQVNKAELHKLIDIYWEK